MFALTPEEQARFDIFILNKPAKYLLDHEDGKPVFRRLAYVVWGKPTVELQVKVWVTLPNTRHGYNDMAEHLVWKPI